MRISLLAVVAIALIAAVPAAAANKDMSTSTYAVIGDTPYGGPQIANFPADIAEINADDDVSMAIHLGDIKNGSSRCDTSYFQQIKNDFALFEDPLVYTPGDNEWTDCHRNNNGAYQPAGPTWTDPSETAWLGTDTIGQPSRLAQIRSMFFSNPSGDYQAGYPENVSWNQSRVQWGAVNVPGSNNDWAIWFSQKGATTRTQTQIDEVEQRTAADLDWLDHIFAEAKANKAKAVAIGIQADMWDPALGAQPSQSDHFTAIVQRLAKLSLQWERPVLLLNGDSHVYGVDHPLADPSTAQNQLYGVAQPVPNLERVTVNGSNTPCHQWLKMTIDPRSDAIFSWQQELFVNQPDGCS